MTDNNYQTFCLRIAAIFNQYYNNSFKRNNSNQLFGRIITK